MDQADLMELMEDRPERAFRIIASQLPVSGLNRQFSNQNILRTFTDKKHNILPYDYKKRSIT